MQRPSIEDVKARPEWPPYSITFTRLMIEFGGWSEEQCSEHLENRLRNPGFRSWFPHDNPSQEAAPLLLPEDLRDTLEGLPWVKLRAAICDAIDCRGDLCNSNPDQDPEYDWDAARQRVAEVVKQFRAGHSAGD